MPNPIPEGHHTVTPFFRVTDAAKLIAFLEAAFGATKTFSLNGPAGVIAHAEMKIGDSMIMIGHAADSAAGIRSVTHLYVRDTDAMYRSAMAAGAESLREPADQFYGDRSAGVRDPLGNEWWLATHIEDVSQEEMQKRLAALSR